MSGHLVIRRGSSTHGPASQRSTAPAALAPRPLDHRSGSAVEPLARRERADGPGCSALARAGIRVTRDGIRVTQAGIRVTPQKPPHRSPQSGIRVTRDGIRVTKAGIRVTPRNPSHPTPQSGIRVTRDGIRVTR